MERHPHRPALLRLMLICIVALTAAPAEAQIRTEGRIVEIHAARLFAIQEAESGRTLLVLSPRPLSPALVGADVVVEGAMRRLSAADLGRTPTSYEVDERTRRQFLGRTALAAKTVMARATSEAAPPTAEGPPAEAPPPEQATPALEAAPRAPLPIQAQTLADDLGGLAGQEVRILNARIVGVFESNAFLVEPATNYLKYMGQRDRVLVLVRGGALRADPELIVGSTVNIVGVVRTLVGVRLTREVPWPARLSNESINRLEVRAAILAASVQTADGVELTTAPSPPAR